MGSLLEQDIRADQVDDSLADQLLGNQADYLEDKQFYLVVDIQVVRVVDILAALLVGSQIGQQVDILVDQGDTLVDQQEDNQAGLVVDKFLAEGILKERFYSVQSKIWGF